MGWENCKANIEGVRKVRWDALWHVLYCIPQRHSIKTRDTYDRVSQAVAMRVIKNLHRWTNPK